MICVLSMRLIFCCYHICFFKFIVVTYLVGYRSGVGSYYGTLSGPIPALSPQMKPPKEYKAPGKNFYTNPGKKGTGYGYVDIDACL